MPAIHTVVEMTSSGEPIPGVRICGVRGTTLDVTLPAAAPGRTAVGSPVTLHWAAGPRGRWAMDGTVAEAPTDDRLAIETHGDPVIEQDRRFVRGGGGERIWLRPVGAEQSEETAGWIRDVSERSVRAHFTEQPTGVGVQVRLRIGLDGGIIEVTGTVEKLSEAADVDPSMPRRTEVVAVFDADEVQAQLIRRHVLHQQMLARTRTAGD